MLSRRCFFSLVLISSAALPSGAQPVISARAGVIYFSDGTVWLDSRRLEQHFGRFEQMSEGSELRTENGRAEVMLTPGAFLRIGENTGIRMISNKLADTRVEFLSGSMVLDSTTASGSAPITILYGGYQAHIQKQGCYRLNSAPPELRVDSGEIEIVQGSETAKVEPGRVAPLYGGLLTTHSADGISDSLDSWNRDRNNSISQNNLSAAGAADLSTVVDGWDNDPDAIIRALATSGSVPTLSNRPLSTYSPQSVYSTSSSYYPSYNPLLAYPGLGVPSLGLWGLGFGSPYGLYVSPLVRYYSYPGIGVSGYRPLTPLRSGVGVTPTYSAPRAPYRPVAPIGGGRIGHR